MGDQQPPILIHELPECERFDRVSTGDDGIDFMREARIKIAPETFE